MGWAADYAQNSDLLSVAAGSLHYQVCAAIIERGKVAGIYVSLSSPPAAGCYPLKTSDAPDDGTVRWAQDWIENHCTSFVRNTGAGAYDGAASIEMFTLANLRADAGLNSGGFVRHVPDGAGGFTTSYGKFQVGDYCCPHLWNEMKACLKLMTAVKKTAATTSGSDRAGTEPSKSTEAAAKASAETRFDANSDGSFGTLPKCSAGVYNPYYWNASLNRTIGHGQHKRNVSDVNVASDIYAFIKALGTWDNNGDWADADQGKMKLFETISWADANLTKTTAGYLGPSVNTTRPIWHAYGATWGWQLELPICVLRYASTLAYGDA